MNYLLFGALSGFIISAFYFISVVYVFVKRLDKSKNFKKATISEFVAKGNFRNSVRFFCYTVVFLIIPFYLGLDQKYGIHINLFFPVLFTVAGYSLFLTALTLYDDMLPVHDFVSIAFYFSLILIQITVSAFVLNQFFYLGILGVTIGVLDLLLSIPNFIDSHVTLKKSSNELMEIIAMTFGAFWVLLFSASLLI